MTALKTFFVELLIIIARNQTQNFILQTAEWKQSNSESRQVFHVEVRTVIGKEWDPETWKGSIWLDLDETDNLKTPSHSESPRSVEVLDQVSEKKAFHSLETLWYPLGVYGVKGGARSPQEALKPLQIHESYK